jgi:hypothetical protein
METDFVRNALSLSTGSTKVPSDTRKQQTFSMDTLDYVRSRAEKNNSVAVHS